MKKIFIFSMMLASFLCSEAKERSLQQKLEIASEVLGGAFAFCWRENFSWRSR